MAARRATVHTEPLSGPGVYAPFGHEGNSMSTTQTESRNDRAENQSARQVSIPDPVSEPQNASVSALAGRPRLLVFGSTRSGQGRRVDGFLAQVLQRRHNHATFLVHHIDAETRPELARRFAVEQLPTIIVLENGGVCARCEQPRGCVAIATALAPWLR